MNKCFDMRKILFCVFIMLMLTSIDGYASKAMTRKFGVTLQDGSHRIVMLMGDEHYSFYASTTGELIIREGNKWRLATDAEQLNAKGNLFTSRAKRAGEVITGTRPFAHTGTPKALVILAGFSDRQFLYGKTEVNNMFNGSTYDDTSGYHSYSSLAQYMNDNSNGQYRPQFDIVGPYNLSNTVQYYGQNSSGSDSNYRAFVTDACTAADKDVNFADYDADKDGYADLVYIVYAGYGENWGGSENYLWPKSGVGTFGTFDGVKVYRYGINQELAGYEGLTGTDGKPMLNGIGVLCHEFCHCIGFCDIYPTASWTDISSYDNQSMEYWDLMDNGENLFNGFAPSPLTAWQRELLGWIQIETLTGPANVQLTPLQDNGKAYRIYNDNDATKNEYYILESIPNGTGTGWYKRMKGNGMIVTHVNYDVTQFSNFSAPNNTLGAPRMTVLTADNVLMTSYRTSLTPTDPQYITFQQYFDDHAGDPYPGIKAVTRLTDYKAYTGTVNKPITEISQTGWNVSFKYMGGVIIDGIKGVSTANDSENSDSYNIAGQKVDGTYRGIIINNGKKILK